VSRAVAEATALAALREGTALLEAAGVEQPRASAEWLLAGVLGEARFAVYLDPDRELSAEAAASYRRLVARRAAREPLQHLLGFEDFHGLRLAVSPDVLVPRPETEGLVAWGIEILRDRPAPLAVDVGTGSGAIACALLTHLPALEMIAVDCSPAALAVAARNLRAHGLADRARLLAGDLLDPLGPGRPRADLVVANLPYVPSAVIRTLPPEVSRWEPRLALDGGADGLALLRRIVIAAPAVLAPGGWLLLEIGEEQAGPLASIMAAEGFTGIRSRRDLNHVERYVGGRWRAGPEPAPRAVS
jgi:release factor glutamine methyltransferase